MEREHKTKGPFEYRLFYWKLKTENNKKVTVHAFGIVHKPKITVYGQWTVPNARPGKKKYRKRKRIKRHLKV